MLMKSEVEIRGCVEKISKKDNKYNVVSLEQGVDTVTMMTDIDVSQLKALKGKTVIGEFEYNPMYKSMTLVRYELPK